MTSKNFEIFGVVTFYTFIATTSVIVNKYYLKSVNVPLILLELQMVVSSVALLTGFSILKMVNSRRLSKGHEKSGLVEDEDSKKLSTYAAFKLLWPMVFCNVFGLAFNIICLSKIDAIMHQVSRGITLPMTALLGPILGNDSSSWRVLLICCAIFSGFVVAVSGEVKTAHISLFGVAAGLISSLINAFNAQFVKTRFNTGRNFSALDLVYYNNIFSTLFLAPIALVYEGAQLSTVNNWPHIFYVSIVTGILGVLINYAGFLQIKVTSPVTHCVSSAARGIFQVLASNLILREKLSVTRSIGIGLSLVASSLYPVVKSYDNELKKKSYNSVELESIRMNKITYDTAASNKETPNN